MCLIVKCCAGFCSQQVQDITVLAGHVGEAMGSKYQLNRQGKPSNLLPCTCYSVEWAHTATTYVASHLFTATDLSQPRQSSQALVHTALLVSTRIVSLGCHAQLEVQLEV